MASLWRSARASPYYNIGLSFEFFLKEKQIKRTLRLIKLCCNYTQTNTFFIEIFKVWFFKIWILLSAHTHTHIIVFIEIMIAQDWGISICIKTHTYTHNRFFIEIFKFWFFKFWIFLSAHTPTHHTRIFLSADTHTQSLFLFKFFNSCLFILLIKIK